MAPAEAGLPFPRLRRELAADPRFQGRPQCHLLSLEVSRDSSWCLRTEEVCRELSMQLRMPPLFFAVSLRAAPCTVRSIGQPSGKPDRALIVRGDSHRGREGGDRLASGYGRDPSKHADASLGRPGRSHRHGGELEPGQFEGIAEAADWANRKGCPCSGSRSRTGF